MERLDRYLANPKWLETFSDASVTHLTRTHSDHSPLTLTLHPPLITPNRRPFKFETMWLTNPSFESVVHKSWP